MSNPFTGDKPLTSVGSGSVASKKKSAEQKLERLAEGERRFNTLRYYEEHLTGLSWREAAEAIGEAVEHGNLSGKVWSHSQLYKRYQEFEAMRERGEPISALDFVADSSPGRPRKEIDPPVKRFLYRHIVEGQIRSGVRLYKAAVAMAEEGGHEPPTEWQVRRYIKEFDWTTLIGSRYGRRAALIDAMPKSTLPVSHTHECWMLDETRAPVWIRALDRDTKEWHPVQPFVILLMDVHSRLILSFWVVDPYKHGTEPTYTADDVLGTLLGAAFPQLAHEVTRPYAGYLPDELRWDKHSTHEKLADQLRERDIAVLRPVGNSPYRQGRIERLNGTVKGLCDHIFGVKHAYQPVHPDTMREDPKQTRTRAARGDHRSPARTEVSVLDLHTVASFREAFAEQVRTYNEETHSMFNLSPAIVYLRDLDDEKARPGRDALLLMRNQILTCTKAGIDHQVNGVRRVYAPGSVDLDITMGTQLHCFSDPLQRRLLVHDDEHDRIKALMPKEEWAGVDDYIGTVRDQQRRAKEASEEGARIRQEMLEEEVGAEGVARAEEEKEQIEEEHFPDRQVGTVEQKRREIEKRIEEEAERRPTPPPERTRPRRRGMSGDPREQLRRKS